MEHLFFDAPRHVTWSWARSMVFLLAHWLTAYKWAWPQQVRQQVFQTSACQSNSDTKVSAAALYRRFLGWVRKKIRRNKTRSTGGRGLTREHGKMHGDFTVLYKIDFLLHSSDTVNQLNFAARKLREFDPFWAIIGYFPYIILFNWYAAAKFAKLKRSRNLIDLQYQDVFWAVCHFV